MKKIQKKISLEQFKSRMPSTIPSYYDNNGNEWLFSTDYDNNKPFSNYGMFPKSLELNRKIISYNTITDWFHFIKFYNKLLIKEINCLVKEYKNAVDYYENTSNPKYSYEECVEFDEKIKFITDTYGKPNSFLSDVDELCFAEFKIPSEYIDKWGKDSLNIEEVCYWYKWFKDKLTYDNKDCSNVDGCVDCRQFQSLGGRSMFSKLGQFLRDIQDVNDYLLTYELDFEIPIVLTQTIDDMGEYSIFYEDYILGEEYNGGTIISYNGESKKKVSGETPSFIYNELTKTLSYNEDAFEVIQPTIASDLTVSSKTYAYNYDGKLIFDPTIKDMSKSYDIIRNYSSLSKKELGFYLISNEIFTVSNSMLVTIDGKYYKEYDSDNNPYILIGKKKIYGLFNNGSYDYTYRNKYQTNRASGTTYIIINNNVYVTSELSNTNLTYEYMDAYSYIDGNIVKFNWSSSAQTIDKSYENIFGQKLKQDSVLDTNGRLVGKGYLIDNYKIYIHEPNYIVYNVDVVSGKTESKLSSFKSLKLACDNIGNQLFGVEIQHNNQWLNLPFEPKTIIHASKNGNNTYWCDYLSRIELYYEREDGSIVKDDEGEEIVYLGDYDDVGNEIFNIFEIKDKYKNADLTNCLLKCRFTYHMGCVVKLDENNSVSEIIDGGVTYTDTTTLEESVCEYCVNNTTFRMLNYYNIKFETYTYSDDVYGHTVEVPISVFSYRKKPINSTDYSVFPLIREDYKLGLASHEKVDSDIYINRGTVHSLDRHLKLLEVKSLESLQQYGNGYFTIMT